MASSAFRAATKLGHPCRSAHRPGSLVPAPLSPTGAGRRAGRRALEAVVGTARSGGCPLCPLCALCPLCTPLCASGTPSGRRRAVAARGQLPPPPPPPQHWLLEPDSYYHSQLHRVAVGCRSRPSCPLDLHARSRRRHLRQHSILASCCRLPLSTFPAAWAPDQPGRPPLSTRPDDLHPAACPAEQREIRAPHLRWGTPQNHSDVISLTSGSAQLHACHLAWPAEGAPHTAMGVTSTTALPTSHLRSPHDNRAALSGCPSRPLSALGARVQWPRALLNLNQLRSAADAVPRGNYRSVGPVSSTRLNTRPHAQGLRRVRPSCVAQPYQRRQFPLVGRGRI
ncbi:hypothetical protein P154DRAFT_533182 [Amniculicola lignicola CBS 123094]|uniref:Uncharacterized protein n=1 Tax=Amniculicola lignicola CBS 123094 TaxID=1392246 RepID=A0A6A5WN10_9PLEO|nr:hypothetical protein P154DRAFT_533182 [Amniculicola lignicola CBS 123094]